MKEATSSKDDLVVRLKAWLEEARFGEPVQGVELSLRLEPEKGKRLHLLPDKLRQKPEVGRLISELKKRFGYQPMKRAVLLEPQPVLTERRYKLDEVDGEDK